VIGLAGEQRPGFEFAHIALGRGQFAVEVFQKVVALLGIAFFLQKTDIGLDVAGDGGELRVGGNLFLGALAVAQNGLRLFLFVPEIGVSNPGFE
jgi:hypothetical protein